MADRNIIDEWFRFAHMDLEMAKNSLATMHPAPLELVCYHCQQSAEKFLKGLIIRYDEMAEKTHDLSRLLNILRKKIDVPDSIAEKAESLTMYGIRARYPLEISVDEAQTRRAISQAEQVKAWAEDVIGKLGKL